MTNTTDRRGMPKYHTEARDDSHGSNGWRRGPGLERYESAVYTGLPMMPEAVKTAKANMDAAANLIHELDEAADELLGKYRAAPQEAARKAAQAVAAGKTPESSAVLDERLDALAMKYRDTVAHRRAVESHLCTLVDNYHATAEAHYPEWRDSIAATLAEKAEPVRVTLSGALIDAREVMGLAFAVESMDRPSNRPHERPRVSALKGKALPDVFDIDATRGQGGVNYAPDAASVTEDLDAVARVATRWLKVDGRNQLGRGPLPEALTVPVADLPAEDPEVKRAAQEQAANAQRVREFLAGHDVVGLA